MVPWTHNATGGESAEGRVLGEINIMNSRNSKSWRLSAFVVPALLWSIGSVQAQAPPGVIPQPEVQPTPPVQGLDELTRRVESLEQIVGHLQESIERLTRAYDKEGSLANRVARLHERIGNGGNTDAHSSQSPTISETKPNPALRTLPGSVGPDMPHYSVVREWGREPHDAAEMGGDAQSEKAMILVTPQSATDAELKTLGTALYHRYEECDIITIDAFNSHEAANKFAERGVAEAGSRVLRILKDSQTGQGEIQLVRGEVITKIDMH